MGKQEITLIKKSATFKLIVSESLEQKIRYTCNKIHDTEWSGILFYNYEGSFESKDLVIKCVDFYLMDVGVATYTEFDMSADVIAYMTHNDLLDCQTGLIHSHNNMETFFSSTDLNTLRDEGKETNNFVSLIVNNKGTYSAAITRKVISKEVTYSFFNKGNITESENSINIEYYFLNIEIEKNNTIFENIDDRISEIKNNKKIIKQISLSTISYNSKLFVENKLNSSKYESYFDYNTPNYDEIQVNEEIIKSIARQLITCSIIIPNESKVDISKWVINMSKLYDRRFGREDNFKKFREWADSYTEILTFGIRDNELESLGFDQTDIQIIYADKLVEYLNKFPKNDYLNIYIEELKKYSVL